MKKLLFLLLIIPIFMVITIDCNYSCSGSSIFRRARIPATPSLGQRLLNIASTFAHKVSDFFIEVFYKMAIPHRSSFALSDAIYNIELGTPSGVRKHSTEVVLRSVNEAEYALALEGLKLFSSIYGKLKDSRIGVLIHKFEDDFQTIRTALEAEQPLLEDRCAAELWQKLTETEKDLFTRQAGGLSIEQFSEVLKRLKGAEKESFIARFGQMASRPELLLFTTLFAVSNERNYIRDREIDKLRMDRQTYEVFMDAVREELEGFDPTERVISLLDSHGYLKAVGIESSDKKAVDGFMERYFLSGAVRPATPTEIGKVFVEGTETPTGSYSIREMLDAIVSETVRIRRELEPYGIEVHGFVENVYGEIAIKILGRQDLSETEKVEKIEDFNRAIANIDRWREKLAETGSDDIKDELVEIAKAKARQEGVPHAQLQKYVNNFIYQEVRLGEYRGELLFVVQAFVRWAMNYKFSDGKTLRDRLDNLMDPEAARRATRMALFMIFDTGPRDYLGNPL